MQTEFTLLKLKELAQICTPDVDMSALTPLEHLLSISVHLRKAAKGVDALYATIKVLGGRLDMDSGEINKLTTEILKIMEGKPIAFKSSLTVEEYNMVKE